MGFELLHEANRYWGFIAAFIYPPNRRHQFVALEQRLSSYDFLLDVTSFSALESVRSLPWLGNLDITLLPKLGALFYCTSSFILEISLRRCCEALYLFFIVLEYLLVKPRLSPEFHVWHFTLPGALLHFQYFLVVIQSCFISFLDQSRRTNLGGMDSDMSRA